MTDQIKNLRLACENAPPRVDGRQVVLDPRTVIALLDEVERLRAIDVSNVGDMVTLSDTNADLRAEVERMQPVYEAAKAWSLAFGPSQHDRATFTERRLGEAVDAAIAKESR